MADRFWVGNGATTAWSATGPTNWSATSGGSNNASVPTSADNAIFNGTGATANGTSTISGTITVLSLNITAGFTGTIAHNATLTVNGSITLGANYTITGAQTLISGGTGTLTSNGRTWPNALTFSATAGTKTLADNWTVNGIFTNSGVNTLNGNNLFLNGNLVVSNALTGTTNITLQGAASVWSGAAGLACNLTLAGTITIPGTANFQNKTLTCLTGTVNAAGSTLNTTGSTFNTPGIEWNNIIITASGTITIQATLLAVSIATSTGQNVIFTGAAGFITETLNYPVTTTSGTMTFQEGIEYIITSAFTSYQSRMATLPTFTSSSGTNKTFITVRHGASCNLMGAFVRIDASGGRTIQAFDSAVTDCININAFSDFGAVSKTF